MTKTKHGWSEYYARTQSLPSAQHTQAFLEYLPSHASLLDYGAGSGRWSAAFLRDRPDLFIDALDRNIDQATLITQPWRGALIESSFEAFVPTKTYDGIWAFASLFFLPPDAFATCFDTLIRALSPGGVIAFTMVTDCAHARQLGFHGQDRQSILHQLTHCGLETLSFTLSEITSYTAEKLLIPTYTVYARSLI